MQSTDTTTEQDFVIRFKTPEDRTRGIGTLFRSGAVSVGKGDIFIVKRQHLNLFKEQNIKYTRASL
jgi:hypothetical protein